MIGSKVKTILLDRWILPVGGVASGRACACSLQSKLVNILYILEGGCQGRTPFSSYEEDVIQNLLNVIASQMSGQTFILGGKCLKSIFSILDLYLLFTYMCKL